MIARWKLSLFLALAYFVTGYIGLKLPMFGTSITFIWLPTGISVGMLYRYGYGCWPGVAIGAFLTNFAVGSSVVVSLGIACGNTLGPILATYLLYQLRFDRAFERQREILLLAVAAVVGMTVPATLGIVTLTLAHWIPKDHFQAWLTWWAGDTMGVIAAGPMVMVLNRKELRTLTRQRVEFASWLISAVIICLVAFVWNNSQTKSAEALALVPLPMMVWAAMRFGATGTSIGVILFAFGAAIGVAKQSGPFTGSSPAENVIILWMYMISCTAVGWLVRILDASQRQAASLQRLLERAMNDASLGVLLSDSERRIIYVNEGFARLTGYEHSEVLGKNWNLLQGPETNPDTVTKLEEAFQRDGSFSGEILNYRKDGRTFWNSLQIPPVHDESGAINGFLGVQQDGTDRKRAQTALAQSEERLRTIVDMMPDCVKIVSPEGELIEMNPAGLRMIEAESVEQVLGKPIGQMVVRGDRLRVSEMRRRVIELGESLKCEFAMVGLKGSRRWLESHLVPFRNDRSEIVGELSVTMDFTDRKLVEDALKESELRFRALTNHAPVGIFTTDESGQCTFVNSRWSTMTGLSLEQAKGLGWSNALHPSDRERVFREWQNSVETGNEFVSNYRFVSPAGQTSWVHGTATALSGEKGEKKGYVGTITDLTELFRAREVLRLAEEQQRLALDAAALGTWKFELDSEWVHLDEQSRKIFGRKHPLVSRTDGIEQIHPDDRERVKAEFTAAYQPDGPRSISSEYRIVWDTGEVRWVSVRARSYFAEEATDSEPSHIIGAVRDISEARNAEEHIRASLREKEAMLKEIHHRVKNNLQIVMSLLSLQAMGDPNPATVGLLQESRNRVRSMALVHETLYGTGDFGKIKLAEYLDQLCSHLMRSYGVDTSRIHLDLQIADVYLKLERAIPFGLIINELVSNALKYAFPEGRSGRILLYIQAIPDRRFELTVADDGVGLPDTFDIKHLKSLGLQLVTDLLVQLGSSLTYGGEIGTEFRMIFPMDDPA